MLRAEKDDATKRMSLNPWNRLLLEDTKLLLTYLAWYIIIINYEQVVSLFRRSFLFIKFHPNFYQEQQCLSKCYFLLVFCIKTVRVNIFQWSDNWEVSSEVFPMKCFIAVSYTHLFDKLCLIKIGNSKVCKLYIQTAHSGYNSLHSL